MLEREAGPAVFGLVLSAPGLGKTITTLHAIQRSDREGPSLIITRPALLDQWLQQCNRWLPYVKVYIYYGTKRKDRCRFPQAMAQAHVILTTNRTLQSDARFHERRARYLDTGPTPMNSLRQDYLSYLASLRPRDIQPVCEMQWARVVYDDVHLYTSLPITLDTAFRWGISNRESSQLPEYAWSRLDPLGDRNRDRDRDHCLRFTWDDVPAWAHPPVVLTSIVHFDLSPDEREVYNGCVAEFESSRLHPFLHVRNTLRSLIHGPIETQTETVISVADVLDTQLAEELRTGTYECPISLHVCTLDGANPPCLLACGHCICRRCASRTSSCPFCRAPPGVVSCVRPTHYNVPAVVRAADQYPARILTASALIHMWLRSQCDANVMVLAACAPPLHDLQSHLASLCIHASVLLGSSSCRWFDGSGGVCLTTPVGICSGSDLQCITHVLILQNNIEQPSLARLAQQYVTRLGRVHTVTLCILVAMDTIEEDTIEC
jgi:hypothetical protein